jgi:hypothetical protein
VQQYLNLLHFPVPCEFRNSALGHRREIKIGSLSGSIYLPRANLAAVGEPFNELLPPHVRDIAFAVRVFDHGRSNAWERLRWGGYFIYNVNDPAGTAVASVRFAAITFPARQGREVVTMPALAEECLKNMPAWCSRLTSWIEVLTKDDLDSAHSLPAALHPERWTTAAWVTSSQGKPTYKYNRQCIYLEAREHTR